MSLIAKEIKVMHASCCVLTNGVEQYSQPLQYIRGASLETVVRDFLLSLKRKGLELPAPPSVTEYNIHIKVDDFLDINNFVVDREVEA